MNSKITPKLWLLALSLAMGYSGAMADVMQVGKSPWGPDDEIGRLNLMTPASQAAVLSRLKGSAVYDLSVEYFIGMPSWQAAGDPHYRIWMTHTPHGTAIDDPLNLGKAMNEHVEAVEKPKIMLDWRYCSLSKE